MATLKSSPRKDGTTAHRVYYRHDGRQSCFTFDELPAAQAFKAAIDAHGAEKALTIYGIDSGPRRRTPTDQALTVAAWLTRHIDGLTGVEQYTFDKYRAYLKNDVGPALGHIPLTELRYEDITVWVKAMEDSGARPKTIANKHGFLAGALAAAVDRKLISASPPLAADYLGAAATKWPTTCGC